MKQIQLTRRFVLLHPQQQDCIVLGWFEERRFDPAEKWSNLPVQSRFFYWKYVGY